MFLLLYIYVWDLSMLTHISNLIILVLYSIPSYDLYWILCIHSPKDGHLSHSQFYTIANNIETNIFVHTSPCTCLSRYIISKSIIARLYGMYIFNFSRYYHITLQITWPIISPTSSMRSPYMLSNMQSTFQYSLLHKILYTTVSKMIKSYSKL